MQATVCDLSSTMQKKEFRKRAPEVNKQITLIGNSPL